MFWKRLLLAGLMLCACTIRSMEVRQRTFNEQWRFTRTDEAQAHTPTFDDSKWETVSLPHTARLEALVAGKNAPQWQGICWYRKSFELPAKDRGKTILLRFEGAMNGAEFWVNGQSAGRFQGGYLPYVMDISKLVRARNVISVRLDNRDNPITGPKPLVDLDFNLYGGLYRGARLIIKDRLHITDPILADKVASGGVFVTFPAASQDEALVRVQTHLRNADGKARGFVLRTTLLAMDGRTVATSSSSKERLNAGGDRECIQELRVIKPRLWSPGSPNLYQVKSEVLDGGKVVDMERTRIGIRRVLIDKDGFRINGERMFLRGTNRHQEYPYIGNALSDAAQFRDAKKIKEAGFDYVRLSHYPQSPAFLDACDELGIVVMNCLMGWQFFGPEPAFSEQKFKECHQLLRRDRNHPSVILWEVSLNETGMQKPFIEKAHGIAHQEYPGDQCYTCGWQEGFDVFIQARQHGGCKDTKDRPCVISEYGDWEYYAQNAGLEQGKWKDLQPAERSSRQLRGDGERRLLQQATNFQEAHNDDLRTSAFADGIWVMFDYNRGYAPDLESSGVMDIFRLPKFGYGLFRSQRDPESGPMAFIANHWTTESPLEVRVFSNCEEVALYLNGTLVERRRPDSSRITDKLKHPPFTFTLARFEAGTLKAVGYIKGSEAAHHETRTPEAITSLSLRFDFSGRPLDPNGKDVVFCYADLVDKNGTVAPSGTTALRFGVTGPARLVGQNPIPSEAGTATILLESEGAKTACAVYALGLTQEGGKIRILSGGASPQAGKCPGYSIRYTTDGTEPTATSPLYSQAIENAAKLKATLFAQGRRVVGIER